MSWLLFALPAPAVYAGVTFVDKYLLKGDAIDPRALPAFTATAALFAGLCFWVATGFPVLPPRDAMLILVIGASGSIAQVLYVCALASDPTTNINIFFQLTPAIALVLAYLSLGETLSVRRLLGFAIVLAANCAAGARRDGGGFQLPASFLLIAVYDLLYAGTGVAIKFAINADSFSKIISYESAGWGIAGILITALLPGYRRAVLGQVGRLRARTVWVVGFNEGLFVAARATTYYAFALGPVALVSAIEGSQALLAVVYGFVLSKAAPSLFREIAGGRSLATKTAWAAATMLGIGMMV